MLTDTEYNIIWNEIVDSTSAVLHREMDNLPDKTVEVAEFQTAGRGQGDHVWHSRKGENLTFSILVKYPCDRTFKALDQQILTMSASLSVVDYLATLGIEACIKKPNDIYVGNLKLCGMLIENGLRNGNMAWSILGIGINLNQTSFPSDLPNPVSIAQLTGRADYDKKECLKEYLRHFSQRFDMIWDKPARLKEDYNAKIIEWQR